MFTLSHGNLYYGVKRSRSQRLCWSSDRTQYYRSCVRKSHWVFPAVIWMPRRTSNASDIGISLRHVPASACRWTLCFRWRVILHSCECLLLQVDRRVRCVDCSAASCIRDVVTFTHASTRRRSNLQPARHLPPLEQTVGGLCLPVIRYTAAGNFLEQPVYTPVVFTRLTLKFPQQSLKTETGLLFFARWHHFVL